MRPSRMDAPSTTRLSFHQPGRREHPDRTRHSAIESLSDVMVVANRLPVEWDETNGWQQAPGGLVTALSSLRHTTTDWIGSSATTSQRNPHGNPPPARSGKGSVHAVQIDEATVDSAVNGMANRVLWPALHGISHRVTQRAAFVDAYDRFNRRFADTISARARRNARVWVHDYHLLLVAQMVRPERPDLTIGLSLHTPFDSNAMSQLTNSMELAAAIAAYDLVGVQTLADAEQLVAFGKDNGSDIDPSLIVSPVSIDPGLVLEQVSERRETPWSMQTRQQARDRTLIVGVDRLDYTKAIVERLVAYELAFQRGIMHPDDVHIVQIAQPSRTDIAEYQLLRVELERAAHRIAVSWPRQDGTPAIDVRIGTHERHDVLGLLADADIAMVTPRRDGMNLVAKEFSIVAESTGGVLVLSDRAGAAAELGPDSILVDGSSPHAVAGGLAAGLELDSPTRHQMAERRAEAVRAWTSSDWAHHFVEQLDKRRSMSPDLVDERLLTVRSRA